MSDFKATEIITFEDAIEWFNGQRVPIKKQSDLDKAIFNFTVNKMIDVAVIALEKQIPKKVKYLNRHGSGSDLFNKDYFNCPSCGRRLRNKQKDKHCGRCGQALDWSDTE